MQLHELKPTVRQKRRKRVGRGGKRGTFSGRGSKGQKARATGLGTDFRGGNRPLWKLFPKKRGASKKTEIKHRQFKLRQLKPAVINLEAIEKVFSEGDIVNPAVLAEKKLIKSEKDKVKILGQGVISKKLTFEGLAFSKSAREKVLEAESEIR